MIKIIKMERYSEDLACEMGKLLLQLSTKWDGLPVGQEWIEQVVRSSWHDELLAFDESGKLVGMATMTVVLGAKIGRNAYLEDFVVDSECRGQGIGTKMWEAIVAWGREKECKRLEFSASGNDKKAGAVQFYLKMGAEIYDTNFFRVGLAGKDKADESAEKSGMEIHHDEETNDSGDDAKEFDVVEAADATGETVANLAVKNDDGGAGGKDDEA